MVISKKASKKVSKKTSKKPVPRNRAKQTACDRVLQRLSNEHKYIFALLDVLTVQTKSLGPGGEPDYYTIRDIVDYLINFPDEHHHPMEDLVYEKLRKNHHESTGMVIELLAEHNDMAATTRSLKEKLDAMCSGSADVKRPILRAHLEEYLKLYRQHINMEESKTFPLARKHLSESDWKNVEDSMQAPEDPVFGERVARRYRKVVSALESANVDLAEDLAIMEWFGTQALLDSGGVLMEGASQVIDVMKHHTQRGWSEAIDMMKAVQQPDARHSKLELPGMILRNNLKRFRKTVQHSGKIRRDVRESLRESWPLDRNTFSAFLNASKENAKQNKDQG